MLRYGAWVAWAAAYALVLNAVLASSLLAAVPSATFGDVAVLCVAHPDGGDSSTDGDVARTVHHCKSCLPGLAAALPPPDAPDLFERIAVAQPGQVAFEARLKAFAPFTLYSSRAPPADI
ncbi:MAG: hypothetical protein WBA66_10845 [Xanthobacteraceae bacterium]